MPTPTHPSHLFDDVPGPSTPAVVPPSAEDLDPRRVARQLYWQGWRVSRIAEKLGVKATTIHSWKRRDQWDETTPLDRVESAIEQRLAFLIAKTEKEGRDFKEIDLLGREMERMSRVRKHEGTGKESDLNPNILARNAGPKKAPVKNHFTVVQVAALHERFLEELFDYQTGWYRAGFLHRIRDILKSRQIGATWYFAREALDDALQTGRNQIFLSASKAQSHIFRQYVVKFAQDAADVALRGETITLSNGAELHFLATSSSTAQGYHGNVYTDEYFWIQGFEKFRKVTSGMALHKKWRMTYFSTPSAMSHEAYPFWTGSRMNKGRPKDQQIKIDVSHEALKDGLLCADGQWRQIVTILDALAGGCDLFDLEQLKLEFSPEEFAQLLMCQFIDDGQSVFPLSVMQRCMIDSWACWEDFKPFAVRPLGNREVWVGYDPSHTGDSAALVVMAPPAVPGGKFRIVAKAQFKGMDFEAQAAAIKLICGGYNVTYIGIDTTGMGGGVYQLVKQFFPQATAINYSVSVKVNMVLKALSVIQAGRLEFDSGWTDMAASFMAIKKTTTAAGRQVTFEAGRSDETSHADLAWATMHCLVHEPLEGQTSTNTSIIEIC